MTSDAQLPARPRLKAKCRVVWDDNREEHLLLYPEGALVLNPTGRRIVDELDGERGLGEVVDELASQYEEEPDAIRDDVRGFLARLRERGLLTGAGG